MYSTIEVVTQPELEPVSVDDLKSHLRLLDDHEEDDVLDMLRRSAREMFEKTTDGRIVLPTEFRQNFTCWPYTYWPYTAGALRLSLGNVTEITAVLYVDENEEEQELEDWTVDLTGTPAIVYLPTGDYPSLSATRPRPVSVEYTAGWATLAEVPRAVILAIKLLAAHWYSVRESHQEVTYSATPYGFDRLCQSYSTGLGGF